MTDREKKRFAESFRAARAAAGLTQVEAAKSADLHQVTISQIESGRQLVTVENLLRLADAYGCTLDALVGRVVDAPEKNFRKSGNKSG